MFNKITSVILVFCAYTAASQQITFEKYYDYGYAEGANSVQQTFDGGYILAGRQGIGIGIMDLMLIKTDSTGEVEWDYFYGTGMNRNMGHEVVQTFDSGFVCVGHTTVLGMKANVLIIKTDKEGDLMWSRDYGTPESDEGSSIVQTYDSGFVVTGRWNNDTAFLLKTDKYGDTAWFKTYIDSGYTSSLGFSVAQTEDSGFVFTGTINQGGILSDVYVVRTDKNGNTLQTQIVGGTETDRGQSIALTNEGGFIVTGYTWSFGRGHYSVYLIKLKNTGEIEWTKTYGDEHENTGRSVVQTQDGGFVIAATWFSNLTSNYNTALIKTSENGNEEWINFYGDDEFPKYVYHIIQTNDHGFAFCGLYRGQAYLLKTDESGKIVTSIDEIKATPNNIQVYPNPLREAAIVQITNFQNTKQTTLQLYNTSGQEVLTRKITSPQTILQRNGLPAGVYFLQVRQNTKPIQTIKILIQ